MTKAGLRLMFALTVVVGIVQASTVLFVSSNANSEVLEYDGSTGAFVPPPFVGSGSGGLNQPTFLTFAPVPEPATAVLAAPALLMFWLLRKSQSS